MNEQDHANEDLSDVCVVTHPLESAGENATRSLLNILAEITTVSLLTIALPADSRIWDDREVIEISQSGAGDSVPIAALRFVLNQLRMCRAIARRDEEIILFFGATAYLLPITFSRLIGRTVVLEPRGDVPLTLRLHWDQGLPSLAARFLAGIVWLLEQTGYWISDAIVTYTSSMAKELDLDRFDEKLYPDGARYVDTGRFAPVRSFGDRERVVGFLGRIDEEKGIRTLADAAKRLPDDITFRFVGDGDRREWLENELAHEIETGRVETTGWVDHEDVPRQLRELRLLVMPSYPTEGLPTVILEGMACGTPVYSTSVSGVPDVVREGETGFFIEDMTGESVATGIEEILRQRDLAEISWNARDLIESEYSFAAAVRRYTVILGEIDK